MIVSASIPTITTVPSVRRAALPEPTAIHNGAQPKINAIEVIKSARRRSLIPSSAASIRLRPFSNSSLANSTIRMAFFAARPMSTIRPIWAYTSKA